jgi:fermentation-respiration switch protein FrsA (DUF1100 family)
MSEIKDFFIRPQRQTYYSFDLGPNLLFVGNRKCLREDFQILNLNDNKLVVSFYRFEDEHYENCLIYLHTHNGSKLEAVPLVESILGLGLNVCIFDFAGYGNSEGSTVSLGCKEIWDIECIVEHLKEHFCQYRFILWGRSMGAVAALLYLSTKSLLAASREKVEGMSKELSVVGGIYDSPFYSLEKLTLELGSKSSSIPEVFLKPLIYFLKSSLKSEINFDDLELTEKMQHIKVPGVFIASQNDNFVHHSHSELLYKEYSGKKELIYIEKDHNQVRKADDLQPVYAFIRRLNAEHPKRWQAVLMNSLAYERKLGRSINSLYSA